VTLRHRPLLEDGGFGDEREVTVQLTKLDTGSSRDGAGDDARLGSRVDRRIATEQLVQTWVAQSAGSAGGPVVRWSRRGPGGDTFRVTAFSDRVVLEVGGVSYARLGDADALAFVPGEDAGGGDVDYVGASAVELIGSGESAGSYAEILIDGGKNTTVGYR